MKRPIRLNDKSLKILIALLLCVALLPLHFISSSFALADEEAKTTADSEEQSVQQRQEELSQTDTNDQFRQGVPLENLEGLGVESLAETPLSANILAAIPAYYVSPYATVVKNQQDLGSCWAFASVAAMEADANKDNLNGIARYNADYPNYSELAQAYHATYGIGPITNGYHSYLTALQAIRGVGPVWENGYPNGYPLAYPGDETNLKAIEPALNVLAPEWANQRNAALAQSAYFINIKDTADIKQMVLEHGAAAISLVWQGAYFNMDSERYPAYYYSGNFPNTLQAGGGHAVTITGRDDSYAASNFKTVDPVTGITYRPSTPGAWLIKNSWGVGDKRAFFWVSYEGTEYYSNRNFDVVAFDMVSKDQYDEIQQVGRGDVNAPTQSDWYVPVSSANIFQTSVASTLDAIGFYASDINVSYTAQIYRNISAGGNPESGTLAATLTGTKRYAGYEALILDTPLNLDANERYSVVLTLQNSAGRHLRYLEDEKTALANTMLPNMAAGQSFLKLSGSWSDLYPSYQSNPIKAYLNHKGFVINPSLGLSVGESALAGKATGIDASQITWTSTDFSIATVDANGKVVAQKPGTATIQAFYNGQIYLCAVSVSVNYQEFSGQTRYETASSAVQAAYLPNGANGVILATGENFPDALTASALAGVLNYPIMLSANNMLKATLLDDIIKLKGNKDNFKIILIGSTATLSQAVEDSLKMRFGTASVIRLGGATRYETAMRIYDYGVAQGGWGNKAFICRGDNFPDALSATGYAFSHRAPLFIMDSSATTLPQAETDAILSGGFTQLVVLGDTNSVPDSALSPFSGYSITRNGGVDRYETSFLIAKWCESENMSFANIGFATGLNYPDALCGGTMQGKLNGFVILVADTTSGKVSLPYLASKDIRNVNFYGGLPSISQSLRDDIRATIG
jgi:putative cell wall-binding protein/C1A family cysteine protease